MNVRRYDLFAVGPVRHDARGSPRLPYCADFDSVKGQRLGEKKAEEIQFAYLLVVRKEGEDLVENAALCVYEQSPDALWHCKRSVNALGAITEATLNAAVTLA